MGRKKKDVSLDIAEADVYRCSLCGFAAKNSNDCDHHILVEHQGQALINADRPMTDVEIKQGYRRALTVLKVLKCQICSKTFRSFLGMVFHDQICGKSDDELFRDCEICGKRLKIHSIALHLRSIHSTDDNDSSVQIEDNDDNIKSTNEREEEVVGKRGRKRNSALKAINKFRSIANSDDDDDDNHKSKKIRLKNNKDDDFSAKSSSSDEEDEDFDAPIDVDEKIDLFDNDDDQTKQKTTKTLNDHDLERIISRIVHHLIREDNADGNEFERKISQSIPVNPNGLYACYNSTCPTQFKYRFELENHYRRCRSRKFSFQCSSNECQQRRFNWLDVNVVEHFFQHHNELFDDKLKTEFNFLLKKRKLRDNVQTGSSSKRPCYLQQLLEWHKQTANSLDDKNPMFSTMLPNRNNYRIIDENFIIQNCQSPHFKSTRSMDSGDNQMKKLSTFESIHLDRNNLMFNAGNHVTAVAWCPIPFTIESTRFDCRTKFDQIHKSEINAQRDQYLILATSNFDQLLKNERPDQVCLQLWNLGSLNPMKDDQNLEARLALNIDWTPYGDVLEMCWCPWGVSYEELQPSNERLQRLGLLAIASEDGHVRIIALPHPNQLNGSYKTNYLFQVQPLLILQDRFPRYLNCNSIDWYPFPPYNMIVGAFNTGFSCLWRIPIDDQTMPDNKRLLPYDQNGNLKCQPLLSIRWINQFMYVCASLNHSFIYHIHWDGLYRQIECRPCQKILVYTPLWNSDIIQMDMVRKGSLIRFTLLDCSIDTDFRCTIVSNGTDNYTDMSLSPWMYTIAFTSECGKLSTTKMLTKPGNTKKSKLINYVLYATKLANIDQDQRNNSESIKKSVIINECLDLNYQMEDFYEKYFFIYEDCRKPETILQGRTAPTNIRLLTKNDLYRYYAINKCAWNPNLASYSWIFSSNKSGLCRVNNYPLVNPKQMY